METLEQLTSVGADISELWDCDYIQNKSAQRYIMLGAMDLGTNLLHQVMFDSWPNSVCLVPHTLAWKHAATGVDEIYTELSTQLGAENLSKTVVLHTMRSPVSQLASWIKAPYDLHKCVDRAATKWNEFCLAARMGVMGPAHL